MPGVRRLGADSEDRAANYLIERGYTLVTRRYRARRGELDLVALDGETLVFVEVKQRTSEEVAPEAAVGSLKARRIGQAAVEYLRASGEAGREVRFDVIAIDPSGIRHHVDAFRPPAGGPARFEEESGEPWEAQP